MYIKRTLEGKIKKYKPRNGYIASQDLFAFRKIIHTDVEWIPLYHIPINIE
jgi:hypothetical protein